MKVNIHPEADIVNLIASGEYHAAVHCANCFNRMFSGVAKALTQEWPEIAYADKQTEQGSYDKLGTFSSVEANRTVVYNVYGQYYYGSPKADGNTYLIYPALELGLMRVARDLLSRFHRDDIIKIVLPKIGAGRAGGDWNQIQEMLERAFEDKRFELHICTDFVGATA